MKSAVKTQELSQRIGRNIRRRRLAASLSQEQLSEKAGISAKHMSRIELGRCTNASVKTLALIAKALRCEVTDLLAPTQSGPAPVTRKKRPHRVLAELCEQLDERQVELLAETARNFRRQRGTVS